MIYSVWYWVLIVICSKSLLFPHGGPRCEPVMADLVFVGLWFSCLFVFTVMSWTRVILEFGDLGRNLADTR